MDRLKKITHWQNSVPHTATFKEKKSKGLKKEKKEKRRKLLSLGKSVLWGIWA